MQDKHWDWVICLEGTVVTAPIILLSSIISSYSYCLSFSLYLDKSSKAMSLWWLDFVSEFSPSSSEPKTLFSRPSVGALSSDSSSSSSPYPSYTSSFSFFSVLDLTSCYSDPGLLGLPGIIPWSFLKWYSFSYKCSSKSFSITKVVGSLSSRSSSSNNLLSFVSFLEFSSLF